MPQYKILYDFPKMPPPLLVSFGGGVITQLTGHLLFTDPPVLPAMLTTLKTALEDAIEVAAQGGVINISLRNTARANLVDALRDDAGYVQGLSNRNLDAMLSSGYHVASTNRVRQPLPTPSVLRLYVAASTVITAVGESLLNARGYEWRVKHGTGDYVSLGWFSYSRPIFIPDCIPGETYTVQMRAMGGTTRFSDWSQPVSIMAT